MEVRLRFCLLWFGKLQKLQFIIRNKRQHSAWLTNDALDSFDFSGTWGPENSGRSFHWHFMEWFPWMSELSKVHVPSLIEISSFELHVTLLWNQQNSHHWGLVFWKMDSAIHWINHYPVDDAIFLLVSLILLSRGWWFIQWITLSNVWTTGARNISGILLCCK